MLVLSWQQDNDVAMKVIYTNALQSVLQGYGQRLSQGCRTQQCDAFTSAAGPFLLVWGAGLRQDALLEAKLGGLADAGLGTGNRAQLAAQTDLANEYCFR